MTVVWGDDARANVRKYLAGMRPLQAQRWLQRLETAAERLGAFPWSGHPLPEAPRLAARQTLVIPHRLIYFVGDEQVTIVNVFHTRESIALYQDDSSPDTSRPAAAAVRFRADQGGLDAEADRF